MAVNWIFVDWRQSYSSQSHILGVKLFICNGVCPSLIPVNESGTAWKYFQISEHAWIWNHWVNNNANCIPEKDCCQFFDELTLLKIVNLVNIVVSSHNTKQQVLNDLPTHNQIVDGSQEYLDKINRWSKNPA